MKDGGLIDDREGAAGAEPPVGLPPRGRRTGLLAQVALLLTVALIPIGTVAVVQTQRAIDAARETYLDALRASTMEAATPEREAIMNGLGLVRGLSDAVAILAPDGAACTALMERSGATNPRARFIGLIEPPGVSRCNNAGGDYDFTANPASAALFGDPKGDVRFNPAGDVTGEPVLILSEPVYDPTGAFIGFISASFPADRLGQTATGLTEGGPTVVLFNSRGEVVSATARDAAPSLPADRELTDLLAPSGALEFSAPSRSGEVRDYAVVPIAPGRAYAIGSWPSSGSLVSGELGIVASTTFPLAMWLVSMAVALLALHRLVVRPIDDLGRRMRGFADGRRILSPGTLVRAPGEIADIGETFETMARKIIRDEADLENTLFEREVLIKEVHHRVKNNLQLMSSILNMQMRKVESEEARRSLRDVQERLRSLAAVHRGLYQAPELSQVQFDDLLAELTGQLVAIAAERLGGTAPKLDLDRVTLVPDQAAPLAMLAAEILTNALKYVGTDGEGRRYIAVTLREEREEVSLDIANSSPPGPALVRPEGLGQRLMTVLAQQLGGELTSEAAPGAYRVRLRFARTGFDPGDDEG